MSTKIAADTVEKIVVKDKNGLNHYHETNSMGIGAQKTIADAFEKVVARF